MFSVTLRGLLVPNYAHSIGQKLSFLETWKLPFLELQ